MLRHTLLSLLCLLCLPPTAGAETIGLYLRNLSPFSYVAGIPAPTPADVLGSGAHELTLQLDLASHSTIAVDGSEGVFLDGETTVLTTRWRGGVGGGWELGAALDLVAYENGFLDPLVDGWHELTGLPEGERGAQGRNELRVLHFDADAAVHLSEPAYGIGDLTLSATRRLRPAGDSDLALRVTAGLPTGDADRLTGRGGATLAADLTFGAQRTLAGRELRWQVGGGLRLAADGDVLAQRQRRAVAYASAAAAWQWRPRVALFGQTLLHDRPYDSSLDELGSRAAILAFGAEWRIGAGLLVFGLSEDPIVDSAPDVVFHFGWRRGP